MTPISEPIITSETTTSKTTTSQTTTSETTTSETTTSETTEALKTQIKKLNSKAGQMKMDLHDIAEGLPTDLERLPEVAAQTYTIYCQLRDLKQQLKTLEIDP